MKCCKLCNKEISDFYDYTNYKYKIIKSRDVKYFCSWTCYRRYLNERNRQDKLNNLPKEVR